MSEISGFSLLVDAALKGTIILLAAALLVVVLRRASAASRHFVWQLAVIAVLGLPVVRAISPFELPVLPQLRSPVVRAESALPTGPAAAPTATPSVSRQSIDEKTAFPNTTSPNVATSTAAKPSFYLRALTWLGVLWLAVAAALLLRLALGFVLVRWFALRAYPLYEEGWAELNADLSALVGLREAVQLFASPHIATPMTWGFARPVIMLPSAAEDWTLERKRVVMLHELAHIRRKDSLTDMFAHVACAVYWFHPLVWKAAARMRAEAERACDDLVLRTGTKASVYADHLLELIRTIGNMRTPTLALPMAQRSTFEGRLLAILEPHIDRTTPRPLWVAGMVTVVGLMLFPLAGLTTTSGLEPIEPKTAAAVDASAAPIVTGAQTSDEVVNDIADFAASTSVAVVKGLAQEFKAAASSSTSAGSSQSKSSKLAVEPLTRALVDSNVAVRMAAAQSLGNLEDDAAVAALSNALRNDSDAGVRRMAAWALGNIEAESGVPALVHALKNDRDIEVRRSAVWALGQIESGTAVAALMESVFDTDAKVRSLSVWALGQIEDDHAVPVLVEVLKKSDVETRRQAAWALGQIEDAKAVPGLAAALNDSDADVRRQAVWALGQIESVQAVAPLTRAIDDADPDTRKQIAWAFGQIEDAAAVAPLSTMLREDKSVEVRQTAAWALGQIESANAVPALSAALKDASPGVRSQAAWALGQIEHRPAPQALLDALKDSDKNVRATTAWALGQIEDPGAAVALRAAMKDTDAQVRQAVLHALVSLGDQIGYDALAEMLKDEDPEVRRAAAAALGGKHGYVSPRPQPRPQPQPKPMPRPMN